MLYSNIKHCKSNTVNEKKQQRKENKLRGTRCFATFNENLQQKLCTARFFGL